MKCVKPSKRSSRGVEGGFKEVSERPQNVPQFRLPLDVASFSIALLHSVESHQDHRSCKRQAKLLESHTLVLIQHEQIHDDINARLRHVGHQPGKHVAELAELHITVSIAIKRIERHIELGPKAIKYHRAKLLQTLNQALGKRMSLFLSFDPSCLHQRACGEARLENRLPTRPPWLFTGLRSSGGSCIWQSITPIATARGRGRIPGLAPKRHPLP
mmetsp:Transcript_35241/g.80458  ORF Transcript_35241/g.80458 Transcript_35241/m.80458 type:complete len:215 (-) Transcript_35241:477-1121(-)